MSDTQSKGDRSESDPAPHSDPARWAQLIEDVRPAAMMVVIDSSMSQRLRAHCSAEDIWQETLSRAWSARDQHRWESIAAFRAWLFEIARNRIRDVARSLDSAKRGAGRPLARFSELGGTPSASISGMLPVDSVTPSRKVMHAERTTAMQKALAALPPDLEVVVRLHLLDDLTMEEIARRLDISVSAAWRRFRKGSEMYSSQLTEWVSRDTGQTP